MGRLLFFSFYGFLSDFLWIRHSFLLCGHGGQDIRETTMLDQILADIRKTFDVDFVPLQLDDGQLQVLNINNMQSHLDGLLARHAIHDPLKDLPLWAKVWPGSFVLGRFLRKLEPEGKTMLELGGGCGVLSLVASRYGFRHIVTSDIVNDALQFARANVLRNNLQDLIDVCYLDVSRPGKDERFPEGFDRIVASSSCTLMTCTGRC